MLQTSEGGLGRSSDLQDLHANERPTDASEMAKRWFKSQNLRRCFRRFVGRNRKSRRREAAGRRNYPEAVAKENEWQKKADLPDSIGVGKRTRTTGSDRGNGSKSILDV